jgi:carbamoyltransferase
MIPHEDCGFSLRNYDSHLEAMPPSNHPDGVIGISGARRNPAAALAVGGQLVGFCEQERITRIRGARLGKHRLPNEALEATLASAGVTRDQIRAYVTAEEDVTIPASLPSLRLDHHHGHAAAAFWTSEFEDAAVLVCDQNSSPQVSVWTGDDAGIRNQHWPWRGPAFATVFSEISEVFGFPGQEHRLEALARLDRGDEWEHAAKLFRFADGGLNVAADWKAAIADWLHRNGTAWSVAHGARVAAACERALGESLVTLVKTVRAKIDRNRLCLGGGLFYNTYFNTIVATAGGFEDVFVAPNPGNAGIAAGAALAVSREGATRRSVSAFLGPEYSREAIKRTVDNCKLSAEYLRPGEIIESCVKELMAGRLVAWFHGRMEWGHRALGNRSILASPFSPYVLDNLNVFLKQRERHRAYGLSVCEERSEELFVGPPRSRWMEYDYEPRDPELFRHVMPPGASTLRVQTIDRGESLFRDLHLAFAEASGTPVLVNTSFNGFSEPIVCSPRDAIRVFYGTGIDVLVIDGFVIRK